MDGMNLKMIQYGRCVGRRLESNFLFKMVATTLVCGQCASQISTFGSNKGQNFSQVPLAKKSWLFTSFVGAKVQGS